MKIDYVDISNIDYQTNPPKCQCGTQMNYISTIGSLVCSNPNCIKRRITSVFSTLRALDGFGKNFELKTNLEETAKNNFDTLVSYIEKYDIHFGAELITSGNELESLGSLGKQISMIIDNITFELKSLSSICGSTLLEKFNIDISKLSDNRRQAVLEINKQLGIDGDVWVADLLFDEYTKIRNFAIQATKYLNLIRPAQLKRKVGTESLSINPSVSILINELQNNFGLNTEISTPISSIDNIKPSTPNSDGATSVSLEDILSW